MGNAVINNFVFMPPEPTSYDFVVPGKVITIETKNHRKIPAYFFRKPNCKTTILYSHGNATDIGMMHSFCETLFNNLGVNILHYEYIGYGLAKNQGKPGESTVYESVEAAFDFLLDQGIEEKDIIIFGFSVGSGPSCHMASKHDVLGLILESPFMSCVRVATDNFFAKNLFDMFKNIDKIDKINCPCYLMHGTADTVIPFKHGQTLFEKVPKELQWKFEPVSNGDHHDIMEKMSMYSYIRNIYDFIKYCIDFRQKNPDYKEKKAAERNSNGNSGRKKFSFSSSQEDPNLDAIL